MYQNNSSSTYQPRDRDSAEFREKYPFSCHLFPSANPEDYRPVEPEGYTLCGYGMGDFEVLSPSRATRFVVPRPKKQQQRKSRPLIKVWPDAHDSKGIATLARSLGPSYSTQPAFAKDSNVTANLRTPFASISCGNRNGVQQPLTLPKPKPEPLVNPTTPSKRRLVVQPRTVRGTRDGSIHAA